MNPSLNRHGAQSLSMVALFAALMAVMGLIPKIDLPFGVPITLQSLGVMLAGCLLGARRGLQAMALFLLAVAAGLPLLSGGRGGLGVFMAPSAGYLVGYAFAAGVTGALMARLPTQHPHARRHQRLHRLCTGRTGVPARSGYCGPDGPGQNAAGQSADGGFGLCAG